jgi:hypothetical protein
VDGVFHRSGHMTNHLLEGFDVFQHDWLFLR